MTKYSIHCPYCDSEDIEMIGEPEYNDWWLCENCHKEFGSFVQKQEYQVKRPVKKAVRVTIIEDWNEREDGVYYRWKKVTEDKWHERKTPYKQKPFVQYKALSDIEFNELLKNGKLPI